MSIASFLSSAYPPPELNIIGHKEALCLTHEIMVLLVAPMIGWLQA